MRQGFILQRRQRHCHGNAVVAAQGGTFRADHIPVHKEIQPLGVHVLGAVRLFLAHHVQMPLQNHGGGVLIPGGGRSDEDHIISRVLIPFQPQLFSELHTPVADGFGVSGAVGDGAQLLKNFKDPLRLQI